MAYVFISSRMSELEVERLAAFHACHRLGHRPMMFEMQPTAEGIAPTVDSMLRNAKYFVGILRNTLGAPSFDLKNLPPILYELGLFLSHSCPVAARSAPGGCKSSPGETECLESLHSYLRGRCLPGCEPAGCVAALEQARDYLIMFAAEPLDESAVSAQVEAFIAQLRASKVLVTYFRNRFDLFAKIVELRALQRDEHAQDGADTHRFAVEYNGEDYPGQVYQLAAQAFSRLMNIEYLLVKTHKTDEGRKTTHIEALLVPYTKRGDVVWTAQRLKDVLVATLCNTPQGKSDGHPAGSSPHDSSLSRAAREGMHNPKGPQVFCEAGLSVRSMRTHTPTKQRSAEAGQLGSSEEQIDVPHIKVRIHHLNVPGIITRMTQILAGENRIFRYQLNVEKCVMQSTDPGAQPGPLLYGRAFDKFRPASEDPGAFQVCDLQLTDPRTGKQSLGSKESAGIYELENALSSIAGVDYVICSDWIPAAASHTEATTASPNRKSVQSSGSKRTGSPARPK